jgi:hypothetical protein
MVEDGVGIAAKSVDEAAKFDDRGMAAARFNLLQSLGGKSCMACEFGDGDAV